MLWNERKKIVKNRLGLLEINEKVRTAKSLLIILETDMCEEGVDDIYIDAVKVVKQILRKAQNELEAFIEADEECTE